MLRCDGQVTYIRAAGTSLVVDLSRRVPTVLHWGRDLGELSEAGLAALALTGEPAALNNAIDIPRMFSVWPTEAEGWSGTPAHQGHRDGTATTPRPRLARAERHDRPGGGAELVIHLEDDVSGLDITLTYRLDASGVLAVETTMTSRAEPGDTGAAPYDVAGVSTLLPLPRRAAEVLDFTGKWCRERAPQRSRLGFGSHVREVRRGKPGPDSPYLLTVGVPGFGFRSGEVWGLHVGWSGNQRYLVEQPPEGAGVHASVLGGGELLKPGEIRLAPGASYQTPTCYFAWSDEGLDGLADRFHTLLRARPTHPSAPRPLVLNTWEAVYFDHDLTRLLELANLAAKVGVERVVLDDGWFRGRRDDTAGLGDWTVDETVWPDGLSPLADHVHRLGMQFGLWFEPEMVNLDSELAREHPEWILGPSSGLGPSSRSQYVVNLANEQAWAYLLESLDELVSRYSIDYLKWDHNRDLHEAVSREPGGLDRPGVHAQTLALYRLIDTLRARHPGLEIESCASGGGRVDLGILDRTDRVWASDCNDPVERQAIQRWTAQLIPPELIGSHVGPERSHTTRRVTADSFRLITALFGHAGIEQDLVRCSPEELDRLTSWAELYREFRGLLHSGRVVRADLDNDATLLHGVVSADSASGLFCWARTATSAEGQSGRVPIPGLATTYDYQVRIRTDVGVPATRQTRDPAWIAEALTGWVTLPGSILTTTGVPMPTLDPEQAMLIEVRKQS
ncbi:alpha-galactosidase [Streptosporangium sp. 'caverna']|uniref:alpha-galactosidase n=1 Tax=Streptosporangium sp. 'caverna' TaxID=2202249 RepID=UPI000D7E7A42|nr:alpha-galactosidase [Streptosporangium sp. 'caverna']AWS47557.1 alpha-galactosidase [Streptosporangium sp. 'caverna']